MVPPSAKSRKLVGSLKTFYQSLISEMAYAQATQGEYANASRLPELRFEVGNQVWLLRIHIHITQPSTKLDHKKLGKFKILEQIGSQVYHLRLPASMKLHPIFHVFHLEPVQMNPLSDHIQPPAPPVIVDGNEEWNVDEILDSRI